MVFSLFLIALILIINHILSDVIFDFLREIKGTDYLEGETRTKDSLLILSWLITPAILVLVFGFLWFFKIHS